jgi:tetratricopeptide (TPR) repeat protein
LLLGLAGCAAPQATRLIEAPGALPPRAEIAKVPFYPQERYYCGPAALAMVLAWSGLSVTQDDLVAQVYTPGKEGSLRSDVLSAARRNGRLAVEVENLSGVLAEIAAGNPVLVFQNLALDWWPQWHFAVAVGYDLRAGEIVLRSGLDARRVTDLSTFEHTWRRGDYWAMVVLPPTRLPATAGEAAVLRAAAGLERVGRLPEAADAYAAILHRWPDGFSTLMGLGNVRYAMADYRAAEAAFRRAARRHPGRPDALNNLAYALLKQKRRDEAIVVAREAVRMAGAAAAPYRATLREISN